MGRLIDADKLKQHYSWWGGLIGDDYVSELVEQKKVFDTIVDVQPTVDAETVKHGRWEYIGGYGYQYRCSECVMCNDHKTLYCPNCGAKMDGERKEDAEHS